MMKKENESVKDLEDAIKKVSLDQPFKEQSEIAQVFTNMDDDSVSGEGMSNIDFNARLLSHEASMCMIFDELKAKGILPSSANLTRMKKRLSVSIGGQGRREKVQIASAGRGAELEGRSGGGFFSKLISRRKDE